MKLLLLILRVVLFDEFSKQFWLIIAEIYRKKKVIMNTILVKVNNIHYEGIEVFECLTLSNTTFLAKLPPN